MKKSWYSFLVLFFLMIGHNVRAQTFAPHFVPEGCSPMLAEFSSPAGYWDFGNGSFIWLGPDAGGGRLFGPGTFLIRYKHPGTGAITEVGTLKVHASPATQFRVNGATSGCAPLTVYFEDTTPQPGGSPIVKRIWDFGPTGQETTATTATYTYNIPGTYTVKLIVETDQGCKNVIEKTALITVTTPPVLNFTAVRDKSCEPFLAELNHTSTGIAAGAQYVWEAFGPGGDMIPVSTSSNGKPGFQATADGSYRVRLTVKEPSGCTTVLEKNNVVTVASNGLQVPGFQYSLAPATVTCSAINGEFTPVWKNSNVSGQKVDWEIEDPAGKVTKKTNLASLTGTNKVVFNTAGNWKVRVTASGGTYACAPSGPFQQTIPIVLGQAVPAFSIQDSTACQLPHTVHFNASASKNAVSYQWDFDNNGSVDATGQQVSYTYTTYGTKAVRLIVKDENGCQKELIKTSQIQLSAITARMNAYPTSGCNDENGHFTVYFRDESQSVVPITGWKWEFFDEANHPVGLIEGNDPRVHQHPTFTFDTHTDDGKANYWAKLTVESGDGCTSSTVSPSNLVKVGNRPQASFTSTPPVGCQGTQVEFKYTGSAVYDSIHWFPMGYSGLRFTLKPPLAPDFMHEFHETPDRYVAGLVVWNGACSDSTKYSADNPGDPSFLLLAPRSGFTWALDPCQPGQVTFRDASVKAQYWRWDFGTDQVANPYPSGKAQRDYLPGTPPSDLRNPVLTYPPGTYRVSLNTSADNVIYVTDPVTGKKLKNRRFAQTGQTTTYTRLPTGELLLFGALITGDSVQFQRCHDRYELEVKVPQLPEMDATVLSTYNASLPNCFPVTVNFNNDTPGASAWKWTFGNGLTSTLKSPKGIVFKDPGKYAVTLEVTTTSGCKYKKTYADYIRVRGPVADFTTSDPEICLGGSIRFTDASTSSEPIRYRTWVMGNGTVFSNDPAIAQASPMPPGSQADLSSFEYAYPSVLPLPALQKDGIPVTLTLTDTAGCKSSKTLKVRPTLPKPDFEISTRMIDCEEGEVKVIVKNPDQMGLAPFRYTWLVYEKGTTEPLVAKSGPDANGSPTFRLRSKSAEQAAEYDIRLILEDNKYTTSASKKGCMAEITKSVTIQPYQYQVDFSYDQPGICPPFKVQFTDRSEPQDDIANWEWDFGDGSPHSNVQHPLKIYQRPNTAGYVISLTVTFKNGCKKTFVHPGPIVIPGILGAFTVKQLDGSADKLNGNIITEGPLTDYVRGPFTPNDFTVQFQAQVDLADLPNVSYYIWDFGNGSEVTTSATVTRTYSLADMYRPRLAIVNKIGCRYETFTDIQIVANACGAPAIAVLPKQCPGAVAALKATPPALAAGPLEVTWTNLTDGTMLYHGTGLNSIPEVFHTFLHSIDVGLRVKDAGGCTSYDARRIEVYPPLLVNAGSAREICFGSDLHLSGAGTGGSGNYQFNWTLGNQISTGQSTTFSNLSVGQHRVNVQMTDLSNGCTASHSVDIRVVPPVSVRTIQELDVCSEGQVMLHAEASGGKGRFAFHWSAGAGADGQLSPLTALSDTQVATPSFSLPNPTSVAQVYTYYVTATDELNCTSPPEAVKITVSPPLRISLTNPGIVCNGHSVKLPAQVKGGTGDPAHWSYRWSKVSGNRNPFEIDDTTAFSPTVTATDLLTTYRMEVFEKVNGVARCSATKEIVIQLSPKIIVKIDSVAPHCYGATNIALTARVSGGTGNYAYTWTPITNNGVTLRDADRPTAYINRLESNTELLLTVTDRSAEGPVCPVEARIVVRSLLPVPSAGPDQSVCINQGTRLQGSATQGLAPYQFHWKIISRPTPATGADADGLSDADVLAHTANPAFLSANAIGTYEYELTVTDRLGCPSALTSRVSITVHPLPGLPVVEGERTHCAGETVYLRASGFPTALFKWYSAPNQPVPFHQGSTYQHTALRNTTYYVTQTHPLTGCESPAQVVQIIVHPFPGIPEVESPAPYCAGETVAPLLARRADTGGELRWYADLAKTQLLHVGNTLETGLTGKTGSFVYYVAQAKNGCESPSVRVQVLIHPIPPAPKLSANATYCQYEKIAACKALGDNLLWYGDANLTSLVGQGPTFSPSQGWPLGISTFYVTQTINGCTSPPAAISVEVKPVPQITDVKVELSHCFEGEKRLQLHAPAGSYFYEWEHNRATTPAIEVTNGGSYFVRITHEPGGCYVRKEFAVTEICPWRIFLPNAFTPNRDGKNDVWQVFGAHFYDLELIVYNRWGEIIFISTDQTEPWDGTFRGELVPFGTYVWDLKAKASLDHAPIAMRGTVTVIR